MNAGSGVEIEEKYIACCGKYKTWDTICLSRVTGQIGMDVTGRERSRKDDINK